MGERMEEVMGSSATDLDGRFEAVRTRESNLGNLICDIFRIDTGAEVVLINSGGLRWAAGLQRRWACGSAARVPGFCGAHQAGITVADCGPLLPCTADHRQV
jgi:hypothetical protein